MCVRVCVCVCVLVFVGNTREREMARGIERDVCTHIMREHQMRHFSSKTRTLKTEWRLRRKSATVAGVEPSNLAQPSQSLFCFFNET